MPVLKHQTSAMDQFGWKPLAPFGRKPLAPLGWNPWTIIGRKLTVS